MSTPEGRTPVPAPGAPRRKDDRRPTGWRKIALYALGWAFIVLGIAGLVLPILQGILFLLIGLAILSQVSPRAQRLLDRLARRFPKLAGKVQEARRRAEVYGRLWARKAKRAMGSR